ncbi:hypothetical protein CDG81_01070 [Actinopolyspora erythraea]|uniref:YggT family protein n=1 Tax=Actinopolyspora erythraea TaxID=414996 RepID=A0A099DB93_9ACTN|nr:hypothetical protein [Actinopolyspora erythraea]ASU77139.1 hypothetical protein CDG81_01070 [Actinopolyspora erythraea]KGI83166.1 hypothetical protein IL38_00600 [Actinopolyspora erythraea]
MSEDVADPARTSGQSGHRRRASFDVGRLWARASGVLTTVVRWVCSLAAALLAAHVVLTVGGANPENSLTRFVADWAGTLAFGFRDLFLKPEQPKLEVLLNYGLAAICWLLASVLVVRLLRALGAASR